MNYIGSRIRTERRRYGMKQSQLAELTGLSQQVISDIENGASSNLHTIIRLLDVFELKLDVVECMEVGF